MANTSASSTVRGLIPCCDCIADSAARRARDSAAVSQARAAAAGKEALCLAHQLGIAGKIDLARARPRTAPDLIEQTGPGAALEKPVGAGAHQERALQRRDGAIDRAGGS